MPPRRRSRRTNDFAMEVADLQRGIIVLQKRLLSKLGGKDVQKAQRYADFARWAIELSKRIELQAQRVDEFNTRGVVTPFSPCDLFTDGPEAYIPPSSGNPIYDEYDEDESNYFPGISDYVFDDGADEIEFSPDSSEPIYDVYCDDEIKLALSLGEPIYDGCDDVEVVVKDSAGEYIGPLLLSCGMPFPFDVTLSADDVPILDHGLVISYRDSTNDVVCRDAVPLVVCNLHYGCKSWRSHVQRKPQMFAESVILCFIKLQRRHSTFGWKPGWR